FEMLVDRLYRILTGRDDDAGDRSSRAVTGPLTHPLPAASVGGLAGLIEMVYAHDGVADLPELADELAFAVDDLLPLVDAGTMLGLATVADADVSLTDQGREWFTGDIQLRKQLFASLAGERAPMVRTIVRALERTDDGKLRD